MKRIIIILMILLLWAGPAIANEYDSAFWKLSPTQLLALTIYGESRGEPVEGQIAVGTVVLLRTKYDRLNSIKRVVLSPAQFCPFSPKDKQYPRMINIAMNWKSGVQKSRMLRESYEIAKCLISGVIVGHKTILEYGAMNFKTALANPKWAKKMQLVLVVGGHQFYADMSKMTMTNNYTYDKLAQVDISYPSISLVAIRNQKYKIT
jgi:spore germination cell wall hydrolase CwlJ-like protein